MLESKNRISYNTITKYWKDTGTVEDIIDANKTVLENSRPYCKTKIGTDCKKTGNVMIGKNVIIGKNVTLYGPVIIGDNCEIEECVLGPNVSIGNNTALSECKIQNSIIMENVTIKSKIDLNNSIISFNNKITSANKEKSLILCEDSRLEL